MEKLARILSKDERKDVRYIRKEDIIPKGWQYAGMVTLDESHFKAVKEEPKVTQGIDYLINPEPIPPVQIPFYNMDPGKGGIKNDDGKNRLELIHPNILFAIGDVMTQGALKYDDWNWYKGMSWSRVYGSLQRHVNDWYNGVDIDPESGKSPLWHAACCIMFLIVYQEQGKGTDDRPK